MQYNIKHQHWQLYVQNLLKNTLVKSLPKRVILALSHPVLSLSSPLSYLFSKCSSKLLLGLIGVLLLPYSINIQALSATTAQFIHGSQPYLTSDNGVTKVTTSEDLLGITISDGTTQTTYTPANNISTASNPIVLLKENQSFTDIGIMVPPGKDSIALSDLIAAPYNYWGDDDGDGQGVSGVTASGNLTVSITDKNGQAVSRSTTLDICQAPYKMVLTSTAGSLTTQYGIPNSSNFSSSSTTFYINPKGGPKICYARPSIGGTVHTNLDLSGPADIWSPTKGFLNPSNESSSYYRNFPTTGGDELSFDLEFGGIDAASLTWPDVTQGGITVHMMGNPMVNKDFNPDGTSSVRVRLNGPRSQSISPSHIDVPSLPQTFELVGYDSNHQAVVKYGFVLKQWFVARSNTTDTLSNNLSWCKNLNSGYRLPKVKDLTNAKCSNNAKDFFPCSSGIASGMPSSTKGHAQRNIGAGFVSEWGYFSTYSSAQFTNVFNAMTSDSWEKRDSNGSLKTVEMTVAPYTGVVTGRSKGLTGGLICVYP